MNTARSVERDRSIARVTSEDEAGDTDSAKERKPTGKRGWPQLRPSRAILWLAGGVVASATSAAAFVYWHNSSAHSKRARPLTPAPTRQHPTSPGIVEMPQRQQHAVGLKIARAGSGITADEIKAPGRITADQEHFAFITPRAPGVVRSVAVNVGQEVKAGDVLATIDSPEVGRGRLELRTQSQLLEVARAQARWQKDVHANTLELIEGLKRGDEPDAIQARLGGRPVGTGRDRLMTAYAQYRLTSAALDRNKHLMESRAVSASQFQQVRAAYEAASGSYQALLDSTGYEARMADLRAEQASGRRRRRPTSPGSSSRSSGSASMREERRRADACATFP